MPDKYLGMAGSVCIYEEGLLTPGLQTHGWRCLSLAKSISPALSSEAIAVYTPHSRAASRCLSRMLFALLTRHERFSASQCRPHKPKVCIRFHPNVVSRQTDRNDDDFILRCPPITNTCSRWEQGGSTVIRTVQLAAQQGEEQKSMRSYDVHIGSPAPELAREASRRQFPCSDALDYLQRCFPPLPPCHLVRFQVSVFAIILKMAKELHHPCLRLDGRDGRDGQDA